jgi:hypothetical protein
MRMIEVARVFRPAVLPSRHQKFPVSEAAGYSDRYNKTI